MGATLCCGAWGSHCSGFSCCGPQAQGMRSSVVVAQVLSCSEACGIFPDQESNLCCPLHEQLDSYLLHHQGSSSTLKFEWKYSLWRPGSFLKHRREIPFSPFVVTSTWNVVSIASTDIMNNRDLGSLMTRKLPY